MFFRLKNRGFTFVETLLAVVILGAIATVAAKLLTVGLDIYVLVANRHDASQSARLGMERMTDEILLIESTDIQGMANAKFDFRDSTGDSTDFRSKTVSKNGLSVPCIYREDDFLAANVTYLDFDYMKEDGSSTIWFWLVKKINVDFIVEAPANAGTVHLRTEVFPRNFMYDDFE